MAKICIKKQLLSAKWMISYDFTASYMYCTPKVRHKTFGVFFMKYSYEQRLIYNPQIEMFARFKMKSSFHKTKRII